MTGFWNTNQTSTITPGLFHIYTAPANSYTHALPMLYPCIVAFKPQLIGLLSRANVADHVITTETIDPMAWGAPHKRYGPETNPNPSEML